MKCAKCGSALDDGALVCGQCGAVVGLSYDKPPHSGDFSEGPQAAPVSIGAPAARGLVQRVKAILRTPNGEWEIIAGEPATAIGIYTGYVAPLAAIGALAMFVGQVAFGTPVPLIGIVRAGVVTGLAAAIMMFALSLANVLVLTLIVDGFAVKFGGQRDALRALKVVAYSFTPAWLAGVLQVAPSLSGLMLVASLYGLYLLLLGLPVLMRCPKPQALPYAVAIVVCAIVLSFLLSVLTMGVAGAGPDYFT